MAGSRRRLKRGKAKVRVGLPKKKPGVFKPAVAIPPSLSAAAAAAWDDKGSVLRNYKSFGVIANPNILSVRARTAHIVQSQDLQLPTRVREPAQEFGDVDAGSDLENDEKRG